MAPEILTYKKYTDKADLWSIGVMLFEMLTGTAPYNGISMYDLVNNIKNKSIKLPENITLSESCKDLLFKLLQVKSTQRMNWDDFFNHPWLQKTKTMSKSMPLLNNKFNLNKSLNNSLKTL